MIAEYVARMLAAMLLTKDEIELRRSVPAWHLRLPGGLLTS